MVVRDYGHVGMEDSLYLCMSLHACLLSTLLAAGLEHEHNFHSLHVKACFEMTINEV